MTEQAPLPAPEDNRDVVRDDVCHRRSPPAPEAGQFEAGGPRDIRVRAPRLDERPVLSAKPHADHRQHRVADGHNHQRPLGCAGPALGPSRQPKDHDQDRDRDRNEPQRLADPVEGLLQTQEIPGPLGDRVEPVMQRGRQEQAQPRNRHHRFDDRDEARPEGAGMFRGEDPRQHRGRRHVVHVEDLAVSLGPEQGDGEQMADDRDLVQQGRDETQRLLRLRVPLQQEAREHHEPGKRQRRRDSPPPASGDPRLGPSRQMVPGVREGQDKEPLPCPVVDVPEEGRRRVGQEQPRHRVVRTAGVVGQGQRDARRHGDKEARERQLPPRRVERPASRRVRLRALRRHERPGLPIAGRWCAQVPRAGASRGLRPRCRRA